MKHNYAMATDQQIVFKFDGANVNTREFGHEFIPLLANVYTLVQSCSNEEVRVVSIENNCIKLILVASAITMSILNSGNIDAVNDIAKYNSASKGINSVLKMRNATLEVSGPSDSCFVKFDSRNELPYIKEPHTEIKTNLTIYGELVDVGGVTPNIHIKSDMFDGDVVLKAGRDEAKQLAHRLYSPIGVNAYVTIKNRHVVEGKITGIVDYNPINLSDWVTKSESALHLDAFRGIDLDKFIAEQRV